MRLSQTSLVVPFALVLAALPALAVVLDVTANASVITMNDIYACSAVSELSSLVSAHEDATYSPVLANFFSLVFPFDSPALNALTATFYISSFPNLLLAFIPAHLPLSTLNTMIAFATGGLLGDTFLNLLPHAFFGGGDPDQGSVQVVVVDKRRNILVGCTVFAGFFMFFLIDKTMRYVSFVAGGDDESSSHSHSHSHSHGASTAIAASSTLSDEDVSSLRKRSSATNTISTSDSIVETEDEKKDKTPSKSLQLGAYLNLFSDTLHNATDGLSLAAAFYASPALGATTTLATFLHEIPHEMADYSILIKSGFSKKQAMSSQFLTAGGAFVGTLVGIFIQRLSSTPSPTSSSSTPLNLAATALGHGPGFLGTSLTSAELVIPAVAGSFIYIASVSVVPELLEESRKGRQVIREGVAMGVGILCMAAIAWNTDE